MERVAADTMLELWLSIIIEEDESNSSKAVLASNGAASSSTRPIDRVVICCLAGV